MPLPEHAPASAGQSLDILVDELVAFHEFGQVTGCEAIDLPDQSTVPVFVNEFWTSKQRAAHPLHEVSYRACF